MCVCVQKNKGLSKRQSPRHRPSSKATRQAWMTQVNRFAVAFLLHLASNALVQNVRDGQSATTERGTAWLLVVWTAASALAFGYPMSLLQDARSESKIVGMILGAYSMLLVAWSFHASSLMTLFHITTSVGSVLTTSFIWALASEEHLQHFNLFSLAASAGQGLGSMLAWMLLDLVPYAEAHWLLVGAGMFTAAAAVLVHRTEPAGKPLAREVKPVAMAVAADVPWDWKYVALVAAFSFLYGLTTSSTLLARSDAFREAKFSWARASALSSRISSASALASVAFQLANVRLSHRVALLSLPVITGASFVISHRITAWDRVTVTCVASFLLRVASFALSKPSREALYGAMSRGEKYTSKPLIDSVVNRVGQGAGALLHAALMTQPETLKASSHVGVALVWAALTLWLVDRFETKMSKRE